MNETKEVHVHFNGKKIKKIKNKKIKKIKHLSTAKLPEISDRQLYIRAKM